MAMVEQLKSNVEFQKRCLNGFDQADRNKNRVLTMPEVLQYAETLKALTGKTDAEVEPLRDCLREFYGAMGVNNEGVRREVWVENSAIFVARELERIEAGEKPVIRHLLDTFFGLVDLNKDDWLSPAEFAIFCKCFEWPEDIVPTFFAAADTNGNGKLEWEEFYNVVISFWYKVDEGHLSKAYGGHF